MTQRALKKKSGSVRPFQQSYSVAGLEDDVWDTCTYTFGSQENLSTLVHHHPDNPRRPPPPPPVAKPTVTYSKTRSTDPQHSSSLSSSTKSGGSNGRGGIFSLFKLKKNKQDTTSVDTRIIVTSPTAGVTNTTRACPATKPPLLHLKKTKVRNVTGETEDHFAIVPADRLREETKNVSTVCSRGWESPAVDKTREKLSQLENPVYEKVNGSSNNELCRDLFEFDKQQLAQRGGHSIHLQKRANRYVLSEGEEVQEEEEESQEVEEDDSGKGASLVNSTSLSDESSALNSLDISGYIEWEDEVAYLAGGGAINSNSMDVKRRSIAGPYDISMEYPPNGMQFSTMPHRLYHAPHLVPYSRQSAIYDSPNVTHKRKVLKPSSEFILMGPYESASSTVSDDRASSIYSSTMSLAKSRGKFSSMPSLNILDKESKKMKKILDKEKKKAEKLEKKKEKLEKKERKRFEKEMRKSGQTLPRNWEYVKKPIEIVYERPRTDWKLTAVPISLDEPIYQVPKKNGIHPKMVHYASTPDLLRVAEVYGSEEFLTNDEIDDDESDYAPRAVVLRKGPNGFGFVLRGAKCDSPGFRHPPNDAPAMQYLDTVDKGSVADKAGLKGGDFILEINGKNVTRASHEYVVNLIKTSGNSLTMNVLTVKPTERDQNWYVHQDGSMTLPHRRRQAPEPPRRDPKTSLSFSKAKSKSFAEGMAEIEKLDQALAEYDVSDTPSGESVYGSGHKSNGAEIKTASIRAGYAKKRVSSVELENLCRSNSPHKPEHLSPSEVRIKKYHKKQSNLEKSQSTPNLAQNLEEQQLDMIPMINTNQPMYRTVESSGPSDYSPYSSCSSGPSKYTQRLHPVPYMSNATNAPPGMDVSGCRHSVAIGSNVQVNSLPSRGKGRNVAPPVVGQNNAGGKPPAPAPPPQVVKISTNKEQPVYASVVNGAVHHTKQPAKEENPYESSFRPGTVAMFGNKTPVVTPSALSQVKLRNSKQNDSQNEKPTQNAMLVTADVHASSELKNKQKRNSSYYEPEPDYESEHEDGVNKQSQVVNGNSDHKTVISINNNTAPQTTNGYAIPQPPQNGPNNPIYSIPQQMHSYSGPSFLPPPDQISLGVGTPINMMPAQSPSSSSSGSYKSATETKAPTPPPPPPHLLSSDINSQLIPPPPQFCPPPPPTAFAKSIVSENPNEFLDEIKRAAKERMTRSQDVDAKDKDLEHSSKGAAPMDKTQAAILQAVAKRRSMLEHSDKDNVVNQIEAQIQKTKKLQSAKYYNSGNGVKKEIETLSESKELCREKTSPSPPIPASKPLKQAAPAAVHSTKPVAPAKPKVVVEKVQNKLPAPKPVSAITVTAPAPAKEAKTMLPSNTLPESKKATAEKKTSVEAQKLKERTITTSAKVSDKTKVDGMTKSKDDGTESGEEDFLKKAEKARQMYLQRRSGAANDKPATNNPTIPAVNTSSVITTPPTSKKTATAARNSTKTSVAMNGEAKKTEPKSLTNKTVQKTNKANLENTKKAAAPVARPQISNGNVKPNRMHIEVQSAGNQKNVDKIGNVSIKDRIASLQKQNGQPNCNPNPVKLITLKGVTTSHSHTDPFSSSDSCSTPNDSPYHEINIVAPPPGFGDNDLSSSSSSLADSFNSMPRVHILPAPLSELSISTMPPYGRLPSDNLVPQDDSLSLISSLSTLSTLSTSSTEHPIEIVPPPPSGFEDKASPVSTDQGFEESFIPPPPQFDAYMKNAASTKNSFRNKPVENWFYVDVLDWLESVQMHQYKINFANHCVDGKKLLNLKRNDYITLGVTQVGHRMNLERSIKKLAMATQQKIPQ